MATILLKPDSARARPSTLINSEAEYKKIFSLDYPIDIYLKVIQIIKAVELFLKPENCGKPLERKTITNIKYYVAMLVAISLVSDKEKILKELAELASIEVTQDILSEALDNALQEFTPTQSPTGQALLKQYGIEHLGDDTFVLVEGDAYRLRSDAALAIAAELTRPWPMFTVLHYLPAGFRDFFYRALARNRYKLFGKRSECMVPDADIASRFI